MVGAGRAGSLIPVDGETCSQLPPETVVADAFHEIGWLVLITEMVLCRDVAVPATARNVTPLCERERPVDWTGTFRTELDTLLIEIEIVALPDGSCGGITKVSPNTP